MTDQAELRVSAELLASAFLTGNEAHVRVLEGVPEGVTLVNARFDQARNEVVLLFDQAVTQYPLLQSLPCRFQEKSAT